MSIITAGALAICAAIVCSVTRSAITHARAVGLATSQKVHELSVDVLLLINLVTIDAYVTATANIYVAASDSASNGAAFRSFFAKIVLW